MEDKNYIKMLLDKGFFSEVQKQELFKTFPQLVENEDERIRKDIVSHFESIKAQALYDRQEGSDSIVSSCNEKIAYLKKQKEHQKNCTKFLAKILKHSAEGFRNVLKKKGIDYIPQESFWTSTAGTFSKQECNEFYKWKDDMTMELVTEETPEYKKGFKDGKDSEKQKELPFVKDVVLGYPGHYFYDGERMHFCGSPAMEEKQKERSITANDLDEEVKRFFDDCIDVHEAKLYGSISERVIPVDCYEITARHFAKWGEKQKEQNEESLKPEFKTPDWVYGHWDDEYMINTVIGRYSLHAEVAKKRGDTHDYNLSKSMENWLRNVVKPLILERPKAIEAVERIDKYIDEHLANAHDMKDSNPDKKYYRGWDDALGKMAGILQDVYSGEKKKESLRDFIDDFPYSDQKEQKLNIELIQRSWYMEGYHDREFGKEPKWIIKTGEGGPKHELNPRYGQPLTEQQVTEEQLHNLNEAIKGLRMDGCECIADSLHSLYIFLKSAYYQQMQEQNPIKWTDLTWKDIVQLEGIINNVHYEFRNGIGQESFGKEVLEKFREYKGDEYLDEKEQKPIPLMNGDADLYFDNWFQQKGQVTSRQCFEEGIRYSQRLQKEQKPVDSNDMINAILSALASGLETDEILKARGFTYDEVEKWLDSTRNPAIEYIRGKIKYLNPEKYGLCKPVEWSEKHIADIFEKVGLAKIIREQGNDALTNAVQSAMIELSKGENTEWNEDWREEDIQTRFAFYTYKDDPSVLYLSNVFVEESSRNHGFGTRILKAAEKAAEAVGATTISLKVKQDSPANAWYRKNGYGYVCFEDGYDWLEKNLEYLKPKKEVEWSEEDEMLMDELESYILYDKEFNDEQKAWRIKQLKSLRPIVSVNSEKVNVNWSEKDEKILDSLIRLYSREYSAYAWPWANGAFTYGDVVNFLKSLRPQSKDEIYKEKDEAFKLGKRQLAIGFMEYLDENRPEGKMNLSNGECEDIDKAFKENDWAKIMRYAEKYSHFWKPSEEQMK